MADPDNVYPDTLGTRENDLLNNRRDYTGAIATRVGVGLSGGGIRSATFALGTFQTLAAHNWIRHIDYLSTVSGGGYFGSFLGRLFTRPSIGGEAASFDAVHNAICEKLGSSNSPEVSWLRENGRYLAPNGSGDLLTATATMLRNWLAVQLVLWVLWIVPFLALNLVRETAVQSAGVPVSAVMEAHGFWISPYIFVPIALAVVWVSPLATIYWWSRRLRRWSVPVLVVLAIALRFVPLGNPSNNDLQTMTVIRWVLIAWLLGAAVWSGAVERCGQNRDETFVRNRLSDWLGWALLVTGATVLLAAIDSLGGTFVAWQWHRFIAAVAAAIAIIVPSGQKLLALAGSLPIGGKRLGSFTGIFAYIGGFAVVAIVLIALSTAAHAVGRFDELPSDAADHWAVSRLFTGWFTSYPAAWIAAAPHGLPRRPLLTLSAVLLISLIIAWVLGYFRTFINRSTYAGLYRARLERAYLGASNPARQNGANPDVTDAVKDDGIGFCDYAPHERGGPLHLINATLNETIEGTSNIEHRDRKGLGMAVGPCGVSVGVQNHAIWQCKENSQTKKLLRTNELRSTDDNGQAFQVFSPASMAFASESLGLADWIAISGAAVSTGLGARTNLGLSLLCGFANIRLGYWWDSGIPPRSREHRGVRATTRLLGQLAASAFPVQSSLQDELTARFRGPHRRFWYLSDGGHFENMGGYELIRRQLPLVVICDAEQDGQYAFGGLANLIRKARIDFQTEITFLSETGRNQTLGGAKSAFGSLDELRPHGHRSKKHASRATIRYPGGRSGALIYLKPTLTGDEPRDVLEYARTHRDFPHETTANQFFDEAQWESYRCLGQHIAERVAQEQAALAAWIGETLNPDSRNAET